MTKSPDLSLLMRIVACLLFLQGLTASHGFAQDRGDGLADYRLDNGDWNGLSRFSDIAAASGWQWRSGATILEGSTPRIPLSTDGVLMLVYPTEPIDVAPVLRWVEAGGSLLLSDDFGQSDAMLSALDLQRQVPPRDEYGSALHVLREQGDHPISNDVRTVVANHPASLSNDQKGLFAFSESTYLLYDLSLGKGRVIVLGDPSVLINAMLEAGDNLRLASNISAGLCQDGRCPALLLAGSDLASFSAREMLDTSGPRSETTPDWKVDVEVAVESFAELTLDARGERIVILGLALLSGFLLLTGFAFNRSRLATRSPTTGGSGGRRARLIHQLSQQRSVRGRRTVSSRVVGLISELFTDELRDEFVLNDEEDSVVWAASLELVPRNRRALLKSIVEKMRALDVSGDANEARQLRDASHLTQHVDASEFDELLALMQRWVSVRRLEDGTGA